MLTVAAAPFRMPKARTMGGGMRSCGWLMRKFSSERSVWAPQYRSAATWISPKASLSALVLAAILVALAWKYLWVCCGIVLAGFAVRRAVSDERGDDAFRHVLISGVMPVAVLGTPRLLVLRAAGPAAARTDRSMLAEKAGLELATNCGR